VNQLPPPPSGRRVSQSPSEAHSASCPTTHVPLVRPLPSLTRRDLLKFWEPSGSLYTTLAPRVYHRLHHHRAIARGDSLRYVRLECAWPARTTVSWESAKPRVPADRASIAIRGTNPGNQARWFGAAAIRKA
jgi:hypothetical protein